MNVCTLEIVVSPFLRNWVWSSSGPSRRCASRTGLRYSAVELACAADGPRTRLNHLLYTEGLECLRRRQSWLSEILKHASARDAENWPFARRVTREFAWGTIRRARSIQPKFRPVRSGKLVHLKRWTSFFETFPVGPNRSIEFWTKISRNLGWMDRARSLELDCLQFTCRPLCWL